MLCIYRLTIILIRARYSADGRLWRTTGSLGPRPFPRMRKNLKRGGGKGRKGSGKPSRPSTGNSRNVGAVRMECNYMISMQNKLVLPLPSRKQCVIACDISGISALKEKQVEAITALKRELVCLPTGYAMYALLSLVFDSFWVYNKKTQLNDIYSISKTGEARNAVATSSLLIAEIIQ